MATPADLWLMALAVASLLPSQADLVRDQRAEERDDDDRENNGGRVRHGVHGEPE
jgi:hypothetical protein